MGIPTSYQAFLLAVDCGIPITTLDEHPQIDVTIDGADQITPELYLIKAWVQHWREKKLLLLPQNLIS